MLKLGDSSILATQLGTLLLCYLLKGELVGKYVAGGRASELHVRAVALLPRLRCQVEDSR